MTNFDGVCDDIIWKVLALKECPNCQLMIYHLDVGTMYPNIIILMNGCRWVCHVGVALWLYETACDTHSA